MNDASVARERFVAWVGVGGVHEYLMGIGLDVLNAV